MRLRLPPLRERSEDIPLLVAHFYAQLVGEGDPEPPEELVETLMRHEWPGNVRELRSAVERAVLLGEPGLPSAVELDEEPVMNPSTGAPEVFDPALSFRVAKERAVSRWERWFVRELIRRGGGNLSRAARAARMDRNHLRELLLWHKVPIREL